MKRLIIKSSFYLFLILIALEVIIRVFHLTKDYPERYVDEYEVEKWLPNQTGISVTGNRRQNFSKFSINKSGYNSYREFIPTKETIEIAIVGDSYIEGFHQDFDKSIGKKIENMLNQRVQVYEYGYAGYDFADQIHLISAYQDQFDLIDYVFIRINFRDDLLRGEYKVSKERIHLNTPFYRALREIKLLVYMQNIGVLDAFKESVGKAANLIKGKGKKNNTDKESLSSLKDQNEKSIAHFKKLTHAYNYDKKRFVMIFNGDTTPKAFIDYLIKNNFMYLDYSKPLKESKTPTTLIYDQHWNDQGRTIIAQEIVNYYQSIN